MTQLLLEMDKIHNYDIIHNDIKPCNIITISNPYVITHDIGTQSKPTFLCKFIDFEISKWFLTQDDDFSYIGNTKLTSQSGTPGYMAPEKLLNENNFIHQKTDIYSLGLVFSEVILEKRRFLTSKESIQIYWKELKEECLKQFNEKGEVIFTMIEKMLQDKRSQRWTARQCLSHMEITEKVDETDFNSYFYPESQKTELNETLGNSFQSPTSVVEFSPKLTIVKNNTISKHCCSCKGRCIRLCPCKNTGQSCSNSCSQQCEKKRKNKDLFSSFSSKSKRMKL